MLTHHSALADSWTIGVILLAVAAGGCNPSPTGNSRLSSEFSDPLVAALCDASQRGDLVEMDRLVAAGVDVNAIGTKGTSPLTCALMARNKPAFQRLLEHGADPNKHESDQPSVTHRAAYVHEDSYWLEAVLNHGGDPNVKIRHGKSHVQHYNDRTTPVNWAILGHNDRNVELLIRAGADLDHKEGLLGVTPLLDAANANMYQSVYLMLKAGADYRARDDAGLELAHYAVDDQPPLEGESRRWQDKVLAFLAQKGVDVEAARKAQAAKGIKTRGVVPGMGD